MKDRVIEKRMEADEELLAEFGEAQLLRISGRVHLRGGSMADRIEALEWIAMFMPGEVVSMDR